MLRRSPLKRFTKKAKSGKRRKLEDMSHGELEHLLDAEVSFFVRASAAIEADADGLIPCFTCGVMRHWKDMEAGHYISRENRGVRWDLRDIRPQEYICNRYEGGRPKKFRANLVLELGEAEVQDLENTANGYIAAKIPGPWLIEQIQVYREKNAKLRRSIR